MNDGIILNVSLVYIKRVLYKTFLRVILKSNDTVSFLAEMPTHFTKHAIWLNSTHCWLVSEWHLANTFCAFHVFTKKEEPKILDNWKPKLA